MLDAGDPRHGTVNGYTYHRCRCDRCRDARREYARRIYGHRPARRGRTHGLRSTYRSGCRCGPCREAESRYRAHYRVRALQPLMCCGKCGGMDLRRSSRSDGRLGSDRRVPGQLCSGCGRLVADRRGGAGVRAQ